MDRDFPPFTSFQVFLLSAHSELDPAPPSVIPFPHRGDGGLAGCLWGLRCHCHSHTALSGFPCHHPAELSILSLSLKDIQPVVEDRGSFMVRGHPGRGRRLCPHCPAHRVLSLPHSLGHSPGVMGGTRGLGEPTPEWVSPSPPSVPASSQHLS